MDEESSRSVVKVSPKDLKVTRLTVTASTVVVVVVVNVVEVVDVTAGAIVLVVVEGAVVGALVGTIVVGLGGVVVFATVLVALVGAIVVGLVVVFDALAPILVGGIVALVGDTVVKFALGVSVKTNMKKDFENQTHKQERDFLEE